MDYFRLTGPQFSANWRQWFNSQAAAPICANLRQIIIGAQAEIIIAKGLFSDFFFSFRIKYDLLIQGSYLIQTAVKRLNSVEEGMRVVSVCYQRIVFWGKDAERLKKESR